MAQDSTSDAYPNATTVVSGQIHSLSWNSKGDEVLIAVRQWNGSDRCLVLAWSVGENQPRTVFEWTIAKKSAVGIELSPDGKRCALLLTEIEANSSIGVLIISNLEAPQQNLRIAMGEVKALTSAAFTSDSKSLATADIYYALSKPNPARRGIVGGSGIPAIGTNLGSRVRVWNTESGQEMATFDTEYQAISAMAFSSADNMLAAVSADQGGINGAGILWDTSTWNSKQKHLLPATKVAFCFPQDDPICINNGGLLHYYGFWNPDAKLSMLTSLKSIPENVRCLAVDRCRGMLAVGAKSGHIVCWDSPTQQVLIESQQHDSSVKCVAFSPDGLKLASVDESGVLKILRLDHVAPTPLERSPTAMQIRSKGPTIQEIRTQVKQAGQQAAFRNYPLACDLLRRAAEASDQLHGAKSRESCDILCNLGQLLVRTRQLDEAETVLVRALDIARASDTGLRSSRLGLCCTYLAELRLALGENDEAQQLIEEGVGTGISSSSSIPEYLRVTPMLIKAEVSLADNDMKSAFSAIKNGLDQVGYPVGVDTPSSVASWIDRTSPDNRLAALNLLKLKAHARIASSEYAAALDSVKKALQLLVHLNLQTSVESADIGDLYGMIHVQQGELELSAEEFAAVVAMRRRKQGVAHPQTALSTGLLAESRLRLDDKSAAASGFLEMLQTLRKHADTVLPVLSSRQQLSFLTNEYRRGFEQVIRVGLSDTSQSPTLNEIYAAAVMNMKGVAVDATSARERAALRIADSDDLALLGELRRVREELARLTLQFEFNEGNDERRKLLAIREEELSKQSGRALGNSNWDSGWIDLADIRKAIPNDSILIEFVRLMGRRGDEFSRGIPHYAACVIPTNSEEAVRLVDFGPAEAIDEQIRAMVTSIRKGRIGECRAFDQFNDSVISRLGSSLPAARRWILCCDGEFWRVPWNALHLANDRFVIEDHEIQLLVTGRQLLRTFDEPTSPAAVFAGADFSDVPQPDKGASPWPALPRTADEGRLIAGYLKRISAQEPSLAIGRDASESAIKHIAKPEYLVACTHGYFSDSNVALSDRTVNLPLLRSGLVLARSDSTQYSESGDDGLLSGIEIAGMDLRGTKLVVLSGCETAAGEIQNGEGLASLQQAFHLAGAQTVLASMWPVSDEVAISLMENFFDNLGHNMDPQIALREAQLTLIQSGAGNISEPRHWAGWTISGIAKRGSGAPLLSPNNLPLPAIQSVPGSSNRWAVSIAVLIVISVIAQIVRNRQAGNEKRKTP